MADSEASTGSTGKTKAPAQAKGQAKPAGKKLAGTIKPEKVILYPYTSEKAVRMTALNVMTFVVSRKATKPAIKNAVEALYGVKIKKITTVNGFDGRKKAMITLSDDTSASDIASKLGML